jgi:glycerol-3-phosphate dehydrogenase subunit C
MGAMGAEMLRVIPETDVSVIERCSGHGGSWGVRKGNFEIATKFARQTVRRAADANKAFIASECPLAGKHLAQGFEKLDSAPREGQRAFHPIELLAKAYGIEEGK